MPEPVVGRSYRDGHGRTLHVEEVWPADPQDRNVIGDLIGCDGTRYDYATSFAIFDATWQPDPDPDPGEPDAG